MLLAACVAGIDGSTGRGCLHMKLLRPTRLRMTPRIRGPVSCCLSSTSSLAPVEEQLEGWKPGWHDAPEYPCREGQFATGYDVGRTFEMLDARTYGPWWLFRRLRGALRRRHNPRCEASFAWHAVNTRGIVRIASQSSHGNGIVRVTAHGPWRCLLFDEVEQGVALLGPSGAALPDALGYQYLRTMAAVGVGFCGLRPTAARTVDEFGGVQGDETAITSTNLLCVGLGTGALPAFLAHHLPHASVSVIEIDPVVVNAARTELGRSFALGHERDAHYTPYSVHVGDAGEYVQRLAEASPASAAPGGTSGLAAVFLDAYDANAEIPAHLTQPKFLLSLSACLTEGGVVVANVFNGATHSAPRRAIYRLLSALETHVRPLPTLLAP